KIAYKFYSTIKRMFFSSSRRISPIYKSLNQDPHNLDKGLGPYLAGLFEGDGHIWMPNFNATKKHNPRFCITFHLKDKPLAEKILEDLGYGFIRIKLKENACVLTVSSLDGLINVLCLINGNMRTPKIHQLHSLIDWIK